MYQKLIVAPQRAWIALGTAFVLAGIHQYLFFGHTYGISYPLFVILFYLYMYTYAGDRLRQGSWFTRLLTTIIMMLSMTYGWSANFFFYVLNLFVVPCLIFCHMAYMLSHRRLEWSSLRLLGDALDHLVPQLLRHMFTPFRMVKERLGRRMDEGSKRTLVRILAGCTAAVPLLAIIILLLTSADLVFEQLLTTLPNWMQNISFGEGSWRAVWVLGMGFILFGYLWGFIDPLRYQPVSGEGRIFKEVNPSESAAQAGSLEEHDRLSDGSSAAGWVTPTEFGRNEPKVPRIDAVVMATVLVLINIVYLLFVSLQFSYLFGAGQGTLPDGTTYAEYARKGFGELVIVTGLNFAVLISALLYTARDSRILERVNRILLVILVACSGVMLASAFMRLLLYEQAYGYTTTRFLVHAFMIFLGILLLITGMRIYWLRLSLVKCCIVVSLVAYTVINYAGMDRLIAERNIERYIQTGMLDQEYVLDLSLDAIPTLLQFSRQYPGTGLNRQLHQQNEHLYDYDESWQSINWSVYRAVRALRLDR